MQIKANTSGLRRVPARELGVEGRRPERHAPDDVNEAANRIREVVVSYLCSCARPHAHPLLLSLAHT